MYISPHFPNAVTCNIQNTDLFKCTVLNKFKLLLFLLYVEICDLYCEHVHTFIHSCSHAALKSSREVEYRKKVNEGSSRQAGRGEAGERDITERNPRNKYIEIAY